MTPTATARMPMTPRRVPVEHRPDVEVRVRCRVFRRAARPRFQAPSRWRITRPAAVRDPISTG